MVIVIILSDLDYQKLDHRNFHRSLHAGLQFRIDRQQTPWKHFSSEKKQAKAMSSELQCKTSSFVHSYAPSDIVQAYHGIPHLTHSFTPSTVNFTSTGGDEAGFLLTDYINDISGLPLLILILAFGSIFIFQILIIVRGDYLKNGPASFELSKTSGWQLRVLQRRNIVSFLYNLILALLFIFNNFFFLEFENLLSGSSSISTGMAGFQTLTDDSLSISNLIAAQITQIGVHLNTSTCTSTVTNDHLYNIDQSLVSFDHTVNAMAYGLDQLHSSLDPDLAGKQAWLGTSTLASNTYVALFGMYFVVLVVILLFALFPCCQQDKPMKAASFMVQLFILILTVICCVEMVSVMIMSDFCVDPDQSLIDITAGLGGSDSDTRMTILNQLLEFYSDCSGSSLVHTDLQESLTETDALRTYLSDRYADTGDACFNDAHLSFSIILLDEIQSNLDYLACVLGCDLVASEWYDMVHVGFCTDFLAGFGAFWLQKFVISSLCFALICTGSVLYQYFGRWWYLNTYSILPESVGDDENENEPAVEPKRRNSEVKNQRRRSLSISDDEAAVEDPDAVSPFEQERGEENSRSRSRSNSRTAGGGFKYRGPEMVADFSAQEEHKEGRELVRHGSRESSRDGGSRAASRRNSFEGRRSSFDGHASSRKSTPDVSEKHQLYVNPVPAPGPLHGHLPRPYMQVRRVEPVPQSILQKTNNGPESPLEDFD